MTTTADFYDGHGRHAVWLGSLQGDADPDTVRTVACGRLLLEATDPVTYAEAVTDLLDVWAEEGHGHGYHPHGGWPWLWPDSRTTDWVFTFAHGRVQITTGRAWLTDPRHAALSDDTQSPRTHRSSLMSDTVSATPAAAHCAAAEDELARAQQLYQTQPDEYRRNEFIGKHGGAR